MTDRNSFVLYTEYAEHFPLMTMDQRGVLFTAIMAYARGETLPDMDGIVTMAFSFIKAQMDKDAAKYEDVKRKRSAAGVASAEARANAKRQPVTKSTHVEFVEQTETNPTVYVDVNVNDKKKKENIKRKNDVRERFNVSPEVDKELTAFIEHRKKLRKPMTDRAVELLIQRLYSLTDTDAERVAMLDEAIERGWQTVYKHYKHDDRKPKTGNRFNQFEQRTYGDDLERDLLFGGDA